MNTMVMNFELALDDIFQEHDDLLDQARGFGMRTAALPRGLMPLREAQDIVAQFDTNTKKLGKFLDSLYQTMPHAPDKATKDALAEIDGRATKALRKFEDDLKKAKAALEKHENLLVGENFQEMFQALRLAVLDLDLTDKAEFTAKTQLYLDANPAYAVGVVTVSRTDPKEEVYKVRATYKAETDEYVADMWSKQANRWFPAAKKTGHARIPAFVKAVVDKMKAVHDFEGEALFGSRRTVEDTSPDFVRYRGEVDERKRREKAEIERQKLHEQAEKNWAKVMQMARYIQDAIERALLSKFPDGKSFPEEAKRQKYPLDSFPVAVRNTFRVKGAAVQIGTIVTLKDTNSFTFVGSYGLPGMKLELTIGSTDNSSVYVNEVVKAVSKFIASNKAANRTLIRKIDDLAAQVQGLLEGPRLKAYRISVVEESSEFAKGIASKRYKVSKLYDDYGWTKTAVGYFSIVAKAESQILDVQVGKITDSYFGKRTTNLKVERVDTYMVEKIGSLLLEDWVTAKNVPLLPAPAPTQQGGRTARTTRTAGATTFSNLVWIADVGSAFRSVRQDELAEHGHREGYPGTIAAKTSYTVRSKEPMTQAAALAFSDKDVNNNDKWDRQAFAVPVSKSTALSTDKVTVTVTARDEKEAMRQAKMRIYATGRFPPNADVVVTDLVAKKTAETPRTKTFEVTGTRKAVLTGKIDGWLFYGWAPE